MRFCPVDFICNFELSWYPFDTQHCYINISLEGNSKNFVNLGRFLYRCLKLFFRQRGQINNIKKNSTRECSLSGTNRPGSLLHQGALQWVEVCDFALQDHSIVKGDGKISVEFSLGRRLLSPCMTIYVPTLLLNIIALATNYFKVIVFVLLNIIALASN